MLRIVLYLTITFLITSSCSIKKRSYRKGYHVDWVHLHKKQKVLKDDMSTFVKSKNNEDSKNKVALEPVKILNEKISEVIPIKLVNKKNENNFEILASSTKRLIEKKYSFQSLLKIPIDSIQKNNKKPSNQKLHPQTITSLILLIVDVFPITFLIYMLLAENLNTLVTSFFFFLYVFLFAITTIVVFLFSIISLILASNSYYKIKTNPDKYKGKNFALILLITSIVALIILITSTLILLSFL